MDLTRELQQQKIDDDPLVNKEEKKVEGNR